MINILFNFIVIKEKNEISEKIKTLSSELFRKKLEINNVLFNKNNIKGKKFVLKENLVDFGVMYNFIPNFFYYLWGNPKLVADIIKNCDIKDIKASLANLFINNFYKNILSNNYVENNLLYVLTILIKDEIDNLKNLDDSDKFMGDESKVGVFMNELRKNNDIKCFFKTSILNIISDLESMSTLNLNLDSQDVLNNLTKKIQTEFEYASKLDYLEKIINQYTSVQEIEELRINHPTQKNTKEEIKQKNIEIFVSKYFKILPLSELKKIKSESGTNYPDMNDYIEHITKNVDDDNCYSNLQLMEKFREKKIFSNKLISLYSTKFFIIKNLLDKFFSSLEQNLNLMPYYVKCICKIISVLIQKKFNDINIVKTRTFISKFFFKKLIMPILVNPEIELFINDFIISGNTLPNLKVLNQILTKIFSFKLFLNNYSINNNIYTPFNWYILDKMPEIFEIFNKLTDVELPSFINDFINDKLEPSFSYDYFTSNKEELIMHKTICFTSQDLNALLNGFSKLKENVDITQYKNGSYFLKTYDNIIYEKNRKTLNSIESFVILKEYENDTENNQNELFEYNYENYYLLQKLTINEENKEVFDLSINDKNNFYIKETTDGNENNENTTKNIIIKFKNFLSDLLYKIGPLKLSDFSQCKISNTNDILNSIKKYAKLAYNVLDDSIPPEWYAMSLLYLIKDIPEDYSKNDFEKLYDEFENEINDSINKYNLDILCDCFDKIKYLEKEKDNFEKFLEVLKDLELNEKVKQIVKNDFIPIKISLSYDKNNYSFNIKKSNLKKDELIKKGSKEINKNIKKYKKHCHSIQSFIDNFPNFLMLQEKNTDFFSTQKNFNVPEILRQYFFSIIREHLINSKKIDNSKDLVLIENKIYDYVMSKINTRIFPQNDDEDDKLYKKSFMLSWVKPEHFLEGKRDYFFDIFLQDVAYFFRALENERSPRKKIENIDNIFNFILQIVEINGGNQNLGVDDQFPILCYSFIKAKMSKLFSNLKFIKLYRNSLIEKGNEHQLAQLIAVCTFVININYKNLNGITKDEFNKNCNDAINLG